VESVIILAGIIAVIYLVRRRSRARKNRLTTPEVADLRALGLPQQAAGIGPEPLAGTQAGSPADESPDEFISVGDDYFCDTARSADGRYLVGACDECIGARGRNRRGACALKDLRTGEVCFRVPVTRANNPHVSVDGLVIVEDWKSSELSGALLGFNRAGERLWAKHFKANLETSGLSPDGSRAFVCTLSSPHEPHSGKTFLIDTQTGKTLWSSSEGSEVRFDGNTLGVDLQTPDGQTHFFPFDSRGHLSPVYYKVIESIEEEQNRQNHWVVLPKVREAMKQHPPDLALARKLLSGLEGVENQIPAWDRARLFRFRGELADVDGDTQAALLFYRMALELDPAVGIKRRYNALLARQGS